MSRRTVTRVVGTYVLNGQQLTLRPAVTTLVACYAGSEDSPFLGDLAQVVTYVFEGQQLTLNMHIDSGNMMFSAEPAASLTGVTWRVASYNNGQGGVVSVLPETQLTPMFSADGRVNGNAGSNTFMGPHNIAGSSIAFGPLASTRRAVVIVPERAEGKPDRHAAAVGTQPNELDWSACVDQRSATRLLVAPKTLAVGGFEFVWDQGSSGKAVAA